MDKRHSKLKRYAVLAVVILAGIIFISGPSSAHDDAEEYETTGTKLGGQLYDNWPKVLGVKVNGDHPLYPAEGKKKGTSSWRCKECHGWDYIGKDGRYKKGSHFTGIDGVYSARDKSPDELFKLVTSGSHGIKELTASSENVWALVKFIREGLIDPGTVFNADGTVKGDPARGKPLYGSACAKCHGANGNNIDFKKDKDGIQGVGWLANDNPQETLHKIRWGHPGTKMPSAVVDKGLSNAETVDILNYSMTL